MKVGLLRPTLPPFTFHWYAGDDPPFDGIALKITCVFEQDGFVSVVMVTDTAWTGRTVIVIEFEFTGLVTGQGTEDVI